MELYLDRDALKDFFIYKFYLIALTDDELLYSWFTSENSLSQFTMTDLLFDLLILKISSLSLV